MNPYAVAYACTVFSQATDRARPLPCRTHLILRGLLGEHLPQESPFENCENLRTRNANPGLTLLFVDLLVVSIGSQYSPSWLSNSGDQNSYTYHGTPVTPRV